MVGREFEPLSLPALAAFPTFRAFQAFRALPTYLPYLGSNLYTT